MSSVIKVGKGGITVEVIADSISKHTGRRITTFELTYHRYVHAEFMTHRQFSRNAASSRAIPVEKMIKLVEDTPAIPIHWGKNQKGMQADEELSEELALQAEKIWVETALYVAFQARRLSELGVHKQVANRILEPFQMIKVVMTTTELNNFFNLRDHKDAQPEIRELARLVREASVSAADRSTPEVLSYGEWHTPYVRHVRDMNGVLWYTTSKDEVVKDEDLFDAETAQKISSSCCAQVSYRKLNDSLDKAVDIFQKLVESRPVHASAFEHVATPMDHTYKDMYACGATGIIFPDESTKFYSISGNFLEWIQYRQLIKYHVVRG